ncbi:hypothetical protein B7494_g5840 [Chlorociboria aeruginascens]|nr:hypothetical protein B7494_g5840 [Chlorociboria aeruginascens]
MTSLPAPLPPMAHFPRAVWRSHMLPEEWATCLDAWIFLTEAHLSLSTLDFVQISKKDHSLPLFLTSYVAEIALSHDDNSYTNAPRIKALRKNSFLLSCRLLEAEPPESLLDWEFLSDLSKVYGRKHASKLLSMIWEKYSSHLEMNLAGIKVSLIKDLEAGLKGDLKTVEIRLKRLNHLLHTSHEAASFFMAGSDFLDSLISCYKLMNPPLRKVIVSTTYLCVIGLTEGQKPKFSSLVDQLYSLKAAAELHKAGPTSVNDSLVAELVTVTPVIKQVQQRIEAGGSTSNRAKLVLKELEGFRKAEGNDRPARLIRRKVIKGKGVVRSDEVYDEEPHSTVHIHRVSLVSQIQDLFPDLGSEFVIKLLDEYDDKAEEVISHLLEGSLPSHLVNSDRSESLDLPGRDYGSDLVPWSTPSELPTRHNVFDDDEFDQSTFDTARLHFGRRNPDQTADDVLRDRSTAPNKAAILAALAAFDSDDDERDDTYDVEDVGGTVDSAAPGNNPEEANTDIRDANDETLFRAYKATPNILDRDAATRRGKPRASLKEATGMTDEAIEGWGLMLLRDPRQMKRLEAKFSTFSGAQAELMPTSWRASPAGSGTEDSDVDGNNRGRGGFRGRGVHGGRGRGRGGNVAGSTGDKDTEAARHRKEANKGSRANHNRRDQRAKKMARGGFPG